jgi:hypothetical protein
MKASNAKRGGDLLSVSLVQAVGLVLVTASLVFVANRLLQRTFTPDLPWILGAGHYMIENRQIPSHDLFSWTFPDGPWVLYQWLFEVVVAGGERLLGLEALERVFLLFVAAVYLLIPVMAGVPRKVPLLLTLIVASVSLVIVTLNMSLRPMAVTSLFLLVQYLALARLGRGKGTRAGTAILLALVYLVWGNMHMGVVFGLLSLLLCMAGDVLQARRAYDFTPADPEIEGQPLAVRTYLLFLVVAVGASLLNPYGAGIYLYLIDLSGQGGLNNIIVELQSLNFRNFRPILFLGLMLVFMRLLLRGTRVFSAKDLLHLLVFTVFALITARFIVWAVLFYALILPKALHHQVTESGGPDDPVVRALSHYDRYRKAALTMLVVVALVVLLGYPRPGQDSVLGVCAELKPGILAYQPAKDPADRLFNDPVLGSCMLYVRPGEKVFIDTRFDFYRQEFVGEAHAALAARTDWRILFDRWSISVAVLAKGWPLVSVLREVPAFEILFEDESVVIFRRSPSQGDEAPQEAISP